MKDVLADVPKHWPHPVYRICLKDMAGTNGLRKAEIIGWRYLAQSGNDRNYAIEVQMEDDGADHQFAELVNGPYIDAIYKILQDESLIKKAGATVLNPALLRINALGVVALWLRANDPEKEIIIPLPPTRRSLVAGRQSSIQHFQDALREPARAKLADDFSDV